MRIEWKDNSVIRVRMEGDETIISANRAGLLSLAQQFIALAEEPAGVHIHYDQWNSLEDGSDQLIVEKAEG